ncbi:hypothetical protein V496_03070 [Pseudogymnoascus sp. VKM F-4515 (FW-2607)]|nr:hypothetical protein V496_03070 [Pseudogymnoascus sp. VKM F-4515 (FW-2607)]
MLSTQPTPVPKIEDVMVIEKEFAASYMKSEVEDLEGSTVGRTNFTETEQKKILRKIDFRLLPILAAMYAISLMDRTNLGLAAVAGMNDDLNLIGNRYTIIIMVFFVMYIIFEIPSNLVLQKAGPANWLAFLGISFGSILIGMGFTKSFETMALCRALLGATEAGFLPGCTFLISCWYKRLGAFWILSVLVGGFAAVFAYVLTLLKGKQGLNGWQWIFIIEGAITVVICFTGWFLIVDFPGKAKFLTPTERKYAVERINDDRGDGEQDKITMRLIIHHLADPKLYAFSFMLMSSTLPGYAYSYFLPIIFKDGLGYSTSKSQLMSAPPYVLAAILTYTSSWLADRFHIRGPVIAFHQAMTFTGMLITAFAESTGARLFGAYLGIGFLQY